MASNTYDSIGESNTGGFPDMQTFEDPNEKPTLPFSAPPPDRQYFSGGLGQRYIEDRIGHELKDNARIWRVYNDQSLLFDRNMVYVHRETIDILLVFAGLFSAVVITILVEAVAALEPDYTEFNTRLLLELVNQGRLADGIAPLPTEDFDLPSGGFVPDAQDVVICGLWFASLTLSLFVSLFCVVIKQWLSSYLTPISASAIGKATTRQIRYEGLYKWKVPFIIGLLPQLLTISVLLFFVGLVIYLFVLNETIAYAMAGISGFFVAFYLVSAVIPIFNMSCPYKTSLTTLLYRILSLFSKTRTDMGQLEVNMVNEEIKSRVTRAQCLFWLCDNTQMPSVTDLTMDSLSGLYVEPVEGEEMQKWTLTDEHLEYERALYKRLRNKKLFAVELMEYIEAWWWSLPWDDSEDLEDALDKEKIERVTRSALYLIQGGDHWKEEYAHLKPHEKPSLRGVSAKLIEERTKKEDEFEEFFRDKVLPTFILWAQKFGEDVELEKKLADMDQRLDPRREQRARRLLAEGERKARLNSLKRKLKEQEQEAEAQVMERIRSGTNTSRASSQFSQYNTPHNPSSERLSHEHSSHEGDIPPITVHAPSSDGSVTPGPLQRSYTETFHPDRFTEHDRAVHFARPNTFSLTLPLRRPHTDRPFVRPVEPANGRLFAPRDGHDDVERNIKLS